MSEFVVGIDLGTATSELFIYQKNAKFPQGIKDRLTGKIVVPSIVAFPTLDSKKPMVGERAKSFRGKELFFEEVKRLRGLRDESQKLIQLKRAHREFYPEEIESYILRYLIENASILIGEPIKKAVITVPAVFGEDRRQATKRAAQMANLEVELLVQEPVAAALAYGINQMDVDEQILVFDFGGGTLDISVLELNNGVICANSAGGDPELGGKDIDELFCKFIINKIERSSQNTVTEEGKKLIKGLAEQSKKHLSFNDSVLLDNIPGIIDQEGRIQHLEIAITRAEFNKCIQPVLSKIEHLLEEAIKIAHIDRLKLDRVLLVGGSTYIPAVKQCVEEVLQVSVGPNPIDPDTSVGAGAAILHAIRKDWLENLFAIGVSPFSLGLEICTQMNGMLIPHIYEEVLPRNVNLPYRFEKQYSLLHPHQEEIEFIIYQDMDGSNKFTRDANGKVPTGMYYTGITQRLVNIPPSQTNVPNLLNLVFEYDIDGDIRLRANIVGTNIVLEHEFVKIDFSEQRLKYKTEELNKSWEAELHDADVTSSPEISEEDTQPLIFPTANRHEPPAQSTPVVTATKKTFAQEVDEQFADIVHLTAYQDNKENLCKILEAKKELSTDDALLIDETVKLLVQAIQSSDESEIEYQSEELSDLLFDLGV